MAWRRWFCSWIGFAAILIAAPGRADPLTPFVGPSQPVTVADVLPHFERPECRSNEFYSEWWSFVFVLEDGYGAYAQFVVSNLGPGDGKAAVRTDLNLPEGIDFHESSEYEVGKWSSRPDPFELQFGENSVSGPLDALVLRLKNSSFEAEYRLKNVFPSWKPGRGHVQYGESASRYYEIQLIAPVARMEGTIRVAGESEPRKVRGLMYVDHSVSTIGMHEQAKRWVRFRSLNPDTAFFLTHIAPPDQYGDKPAQYAVLFRDGRVQFETLAFDLKFGDVRPDPEKAGYASPWVVEASGANGTRFRAAIKATKMTSREDYLETVGAAKRFVLSKFAKPIMYYFDAAYAVETPADGGGKKYGGKGRYYFTIVNP